MTDNELQDQVELGKEAGEASAYITKLVERAKLEIMSEICGLSPLDKEAFSVLMSKFRFTDSVLEAVQGDIYMGQEAYNQLKGIKDSGGIL